MTGRALATVLIGAAVATFSTTLPAAAAVRQCAPRLETFADAATETGARQKALELWAAGARGIGQGFTRWQLAGNRGIQCSRVATGFRCRAGGAPCMITQAPGKTPQELQPKAAPPGPGPGPAAPRKTGIDA